MTIVLMVVCFAAIVFNVRFFVALCQERKAISTSSQSGKDGNTTKQKQLIERPENGFDMDRPLGMLDNTNQLKKG